MSQTSLVVYNENQPDAQVFTHVLLILLHALQEINPAFSAVF